MHELFKALSEPQRIAILRLVHSGELPAGEIAAHFRTTRQAVSQHLRLLTSVGLLKLRRDGAKRLYRVHHEAFGDLRTFIDVFWNHSLASLKRRVEQDKARRHGGR
jgi:DNA-binding transcriptional ArsR family regulator